MDLLEQSAAKSTEGGYSQAEVDWTRLASKCVSECWVEGPSIAEQCSSHS